MKLWSKRIEKLIGSLKQEQEQKAIKHDDDDGLAEAINKLTKQNQNILHLPTISRKTHIETDNNQQNKQHLVKPLTTNNKMMKKEVFNSQIIPTQNINPEKQIETNNDQQLQTEILNPNNEQNQQSLMQ